MPQFLPLVSSGLLHPKKRDSAYARQIVYLNYGLVALGARLRDSGFDVTIYHGGYHDPLARARDIGSRLDDDGLLLLSLPSFYSIPWAIRFCEAIMALCPRAQVIAGGRWVVDRNQRWLHRHLPTVKRFVPGIADDSIDRVVARALETRPLKDTKSPFPPLLDYSLLDECKEFTPSVEQSRGCGRGCAFCSEKGQSLQTASPVSVADNLVALTNVYGDHSNCYMEASRFEPDQAWVDAFCRAYSDRECMVRWRCEVRMDGLSAASLDALSKHGLAVLDCGLESASSTQLIRMQKTHDVRTYLSRARELLRVSYDCGVWAKINVMLYPGETHDTIAETFDWLDSVRQYVKGISAYPLVVYGPNATGASFLKSVTEFGAMPLDDGLMGKGFVQLHLSKEIDAPSSIAEANAISRAFMSSEDYWDLKSFNYFRKSYTKGKFLEDLEHIDVGELPFKHPPRPYQPDIAMDSPI